MTPDRAWPLPPADIEQPERPERPESSWTPPEYPPAPLPRLVHPAPIQDPALLQRREELEMRKLTERIRWRIATMLNRLPGQCWADLVTWALRYTEARNPWSPNARCQESAAECGSCYCGKLRGPEGGA